MSLQQNRKVSFSDINKSLSVTNGNTGIGTTAPSHTLDVNGGLRSTNFTTTNALITNVTTTTLSVSSLISVSDTANAPAGAVTGSNVRFSNNGMSYNHQLPPDEYNPSGSQETRPYNYSSDYFVTALLVDPTPGYDPYAYFYNPTAFKYTGSSSAVVNWRVQTPGANAPMFGTYTIYVDILDTDGTTIISTPATLVYSSGSLVTDTGIETTTLNPNQYIRFRGSGMSATINNFVFTYDLSANISGLIANSSGITTGTLKSTSIISTTGTVGTLINTNTVSTNISSATLNLSSGITAASANITTSLMAIGNSNTIGNIYTTGGNVGIGAISPTSKLTIQTPDPAVNFSLLDFRNPNYGIYAQSDSINARGNTLRFLASDYNTNNVTTRDILTMRPEGNVGIGTSSPSTKLNVVGDTDIFGTLRVGANSNSGAFLINLGTTGVGSYRSAHLVGDGTNIVFSNQQNGSINFATNNIANRLVIAADGRVSIGLDTPANNGLQINSGELQLGPKTSSSFHMYAVSGNLEFYSGSWGAGTYAGKWTNSGLQVVGSLSKGSGTFDIKHPLHPNDETKRLVHSFIEGPRCDLIYRGEVQLVNGTATINIDSDCVAEPGCEMTQGTFEALCANPHFFLQNPSSFSRLKGNIQGNILTIECEDQDSSDIVYWNIIAERKDNTIKQWNRTNENGYLITEYDKDDVPSL